VYRTRTAALYLMEGVSSPLRPDRRMAKPPFLPNEVRDPIGDVVLDELIERVLAGETFRPNDFEPKFSDTIIANVFQLTS